ncbi:MAG: hypothetical protein DRG27_05835 [Deltaproteobacteria bacterium]|nr:MAG: hypothetical protein DRG27_05835 [Deltaproteobacteria bacterium]
MDKEVKIMVVDGQGGGIGATLISAIRKELGDNIIIYALGTNSIATARMMKAGANKGGTGESAIKYVSTKVDIIIGPISIVMPYSMLGELTPDMATAISTSNALKRFLPLTQENVKIVGDPGEPLPHQVTEAIRIIKEVIEDV